MIENSRRTGLRTVGLGALAIAGAAMMSAGLATAEAAAPKCKTSVGSSSNYTCTTDFKAPSKPDYTAIRTGPKRFKAKLPPCPKIPRGPCKKRR